MINGKEKFDPNSIEFPLEEQPPSNEAVVAKHGSKSQVEMFDEPMLSASSSFKEIKYEEKMTYVDWIEKELGLDKDQADSQLS